MSKKAIIIGAGINGLCLAEALIEDGYKVEVFDAGPIPNIESPSNLKVQIVRPQYVEQIGLGLRIAPSLSAWRTVFEKLGENYFSPTGVVAVSRKEGDWADRAMDLMRQNNLPFRYVHGAVLKDLLPALKIEHVRMGILADMGGQIRARDLISNLHQYLTEKGVIFHPCEAVLSVDVDGTKVKTKRKSYDADWVIVTASVDDLLPSFDFEMKEFLGCVCDVAPPAHKQDLWRFAPIWVDLGAEANCWGIPRFEQKLLRVGAGMFSADVNATDDAVFDRLETLYSELIADYEQYSLVEFRRIRYKGYQNGELVLKRQKQVIGLAADSGHGFKFAAENAQAIAQALENDTLTIAARQIAGL